MVNFVLSNYFKKICMKYVPIFYNHKIHKKIFFKIICLKKNYFGANLKTYFKSIFKKQNF